MIQKGDVYLGNPGLLRNAQHKKITLVNVQVEKTPRIVERAGSPARERYEKKNWLVVSTHLNNPYNGYIDPYYWVDDHPVLYGREFRPWHI